MGFSAEFDAHLAFGDEEHALGIGIWLRLVATAARRHFQIKCPACRAMNTSVATATHSESGSPKTVVTPVAPMLGIVCATEVLMSSRCCADRRPETPKAPSRACFKPRALT